MLSIATRFLCPILINKKMTNLSQFTHWTELRFYLREMVWMCEMHEPRPIGRTIFVRFKRMNRGGGVEQLDAKWRLLNAIGHLCRVTLSNIRPHFIAQLWITCWNCCYRLYSRCDSALVLLNTSGAINLRWLMGSAVVLRIGIWKQPIRILRWFVGGVHIVISK